jgi:phosphate transport system permease protein
MERMGGAPDPIEPVDTDSPRDLSHKVTGSDRTFRNVARTSGALVLAIMGLVGIFLTLRASEALKKDGLWKFLTTQAWEPDANNFGIAAVLTGTILIALVAIFFAMPLAIGTALYISEYAPNKIKSTLVSLIDLMPAMKVDDVNSVSVASGSPGV